MVQTKALRWKMITVVPGTLPCLLESHWRTSPPAPHHQFQQIPFIKKSDYVKQFNLVVL